MALKDEPMPKLTFFGAGTSLLKSYKNIIFHLISTLLRAVKSCWLLLAGCQLLHGCRCS